MSYIGNQSENKVAPSQLREYLAPNGSATYFDLGQDVPGYGSENVMVMVNNVIQEPSVAYTIINDASGRPRRLNFGVALAATDTAYVIHQGVGTLYHTPPTNSVGYAQLEANLRSGRVDQFLGSAGATSNTVFTLTESALNVNSIMVYVNGIYQRPTTNYTVVGTALTFTSSLENADEVDVHHMSIRSTVSHVADGSVGSSQLVGGSVGSSQLADGSVSLSKISSSGISSQGASKPSSPFVGQNWFNINSGVTYQYINDGTSNLWLDTTSDGIGTSANRSVDYVGDVDPPVNHNGGSATLSVGQIYYNRVRDRHFTCTNATSGSNVWLGVDDLSGRLGGIITTYTGFRVHTFLSSGTFTLGSTVAVDYLVVAGGGGGGKLDGGGGGAGGLLTAASFSMGAGSYAITVGGGGGGSNSPSARGTIGQLSSIAGSGITTITSTGGGGGGTHTAGAEEIGGVGGSGGGTAHNNDSDPGGGRTASPVQGNIGGIGHAGGGTANAGGGGGGAGEAGNTDGNAQGGDGLANSYRTGSPVTYAGGGGGGRDSGQATGGVSGDGGGGHGSNNNAGANGTAGTANTGGGGGGGGYNSGTGGNGFAGGSGIVVIRYAI